VKAPADADVVVVGGGASGLMAAGQAAREGASTLVLEKKPRPGLKLRITGKGRCNLSNTAGLEEFIRHFGEAGPFLRQALQGFFVKDLIDFFRANGLETKVERGGRVFPTSDRAQDVVAALLGWTRGLGVRIRTREPVREILVRDGAVTGVRTERAYSARAVILAAGGASYPATGSTGDGFRLAEGLGHRIVPVRPALVPLETEAHGIPGGLSLRNVLVRVLVNGRKRREAFGEAMFTDRGLSGPVILTLSRMIVDELRKGSRVRLSLDLKPALEPRKLDARLQRELALGGGKALKNQLKGLLPRLLIPVCLEHAEIDGEKPCHQTTSLERKRLLGWLKDYQLDVTGHMPLEEAIVTAGGVKRSEIDPRAMESRLVKGLFFCGEVIDMDADTGGYNLQAAFSTGVLAGRSAARRLEALERFERRE